MWHSKSKRATSWIVGIYIMAQVGLALEEATNTQFSTVWHMGCIHYMSDTDYNLGSTLGG